MFVDVQRKVEKSLIVLAPRNSPPSTCLFTTVPPISSLQAISDPPLSTRLPHETVGVASSSGICAPLRYHVGCTACAAVGVMANATVASIGVRTIRSFLAMSYFPSSQDWPLDIGSSNPFAPTILVCG